MDQRDADDGFAPPTPEPAPVPPENTKKRRGCLGLFAVAVALIIGFAVAGNKNNDASSSDTGTTDTTTTAAPFDQATDVTDTSVAVADPTTTQPTVAAQVTFACTGSAPNGVDITYGPSGSNFSASSLPFTKTATLDTSAQYYVTEAQLQGGGNVTCTTTIQRSDGSTVVNTASASGDYNIASAQVCGTIDGGWDKC